MSDAITTDVLVIGAGGAGCRAAIEAAEQGARVTMLIKGRLGNSGCTLNVGTSCVVGLGGDRSDSIDASLRDLISYGGYLGDQELARILITETADRVREMEEWGIDFERNADGSIAMYHAAAHSHKRNFTFKSSAVVENAAGVGGAGAGPEYGSPPGMAMMDILVQQVLGRDIDILEDHVLVDLVKADGRVVGATALDMKSDRLTVINAKAVILATGTYSQIFEPTTVSPGESGDGHAAAYRAGAELIDMEAAQFVATSTGAPTGTVFLNTKGEAFLPRYGIEGHTSIPKEPLVYAVAREIMEGRGTPNGSIYLDLRPVFAGAGPKPWYVPIIEKRLNDAGIDPRKDLVESYPRSHTAIGGVRINARCETSAPGLYAAGAVAGGLYGVARPEGYTSMITLVYGRRAGLHAAQAVQNMAPPKLDDAAVDASRRRVSRIVGTAARLTPDEAIKQIKSATYKYAWVIKDERGLRQGLQEMRRIADASKTFKVADGYEHAKALEAHNMLLSAELLILGSLERKESRGAFFRHDYPKMDNANWLKNIVYSQVNGQLAMRTSTPEMKYVKPLDGPHAPAGRGFGGEVV